MQSFAFIVEQHTRSPSPTLRSAVGDDGTPGHSRRHRPQGTALHRAKRRGKRIYGRDPKRAEPEFGLCASPRVPSVAHALGVCDLGRAQSIRESPPADHGTTLAVVMQVSVAEDLEGPPDVFPVLSGPPGALFRQNWRRQADRRPAASARGTVVPRARVTVAALSAGAHAASPRHGCGVGTGGKPLHSAFWRGSTRCSRAPRRVPGRGHSRAPRRGLWHVRGYVTTGERAYSDRGAASGLSGTRKFNRLGSGTP